MNRQFSKSALRRVASAIQRLTLLAGAALIVTVTIAVGASAQDVSIATVAHQQYRVVVLPVDGGTDSLLAGYLSYAPLNQRGTVGVLGDTGSPNVNNSYTWTAGVQTDLDALPPGPDGSGDNTYINWINSWGLSAGFATHIDANTGTSADHAVVWAPDGEIFDIQPKTVAQSHAVWVNDLGEVSGWLASTTTDPCSFGTGLAHTEGFIWQFGVLRRLGTLGGTDSYGEFINDLGQVSGHSQTSNTADPNTGCPPFDPFIWENGHMTDINPGNFGGAQGGTNFLSNRGHAVGFGTTAGEAGVDPFLWHDGVLTNLNVVGTLGGGFGSALNVNDRDHVVGVNATADDSADHAVLWRDGKFIDLSTLSGYDCSTATRINNADQIVGFSYLCASQGAVAHASLWENGELVDLNTVIPGDSGIELQYASWVTEGGVIAAQGVLTGGSHMGATRAVLLIPNGPCDAGAQAAAAAALKHKAEALRSAAANGRKGWFIRGAGGRVNPMLVKPPSPAELRSHAQARSPE